MPTKADNENDVILEMHHVGNYKEFLCIDKTFQSYNKYLTCMYVSMCCDVYGSSQGRVRRSQVFLTPTRRVSWYPRRVIKGSGFLADYSLVVSHT
jgi:hypothetical protein